MRERARLVTVRDSTLNGFELQYYTKEAVTAARFKEILTRGHIFTSIEKLQHDALIHFRHNLLETNIYNFAEFAKRYDVDPAVCVAAIFVGGIGRGKLYLQLNLKLVDGCTRCDSNTQQGILYIKQDDIYPYNDNAPLTVLEMPGLTIQEAQLMNNTLIFGSVNGYKDSPGSLSMSTVTHRKSV